MMKRFKNILLLVLAMCMLLSLCACGGNSGNSDDSNTQQTTTASTEETTEATEATEDDGKVTYKVTVVDDSGNPVAGVMVQMCLEACIPAITDANGVATWNLEEADYQVSFVNVPENFGPDANKYSFESGSYELTLTLNRVATNS